MALCSLNPLRIFSDFTDMNISAPPGDHVSSLSALTAPPQESDPFELVCGGGQFRWKAHPSNADAARGQ